MPISLTLLPETYALMKLDPAHTIPEVIYRSSFYSVSRSPSELSILCNQLYAVGGNIDPDWRLFEYKGSVEAGESGVVASIVAPLAMAEISVIVNTTYDSGYFGVKTNNIDLGITTLRAAGLQVLP